MPSPNVDQIFAPVQADLAAIDAANQSLVPALAAQQAATVALATAQANAATANAAVTAAQAAPAAALAQLDTDLQTAISQLGGTATFPTPQPPTTTPAGSLGLTITASASPSVSPVGTNTTFAVGVSNTGAANLTGVSVSFSIPTGTTFVSAQMTEGAYNPSTGVWSVGPVQSGTSDSLSVTVSVQGPLPISATATITAADQAPGITPIVSAPATITAS
jgi:uncharacterized repeat protein (TIGR01451 family)